MTRCLFLFNSASGSAALFLFNTCVGIQYLYLTQVPGAIVTKLDQLKLKQAKKNDAKKKPTKDGEDQGARGRAAGRGRAGRGRGRGRGRGSATIADDGELDIDDEEIWEEYRKFCGWTSDDDDG